MSADKREQRISGYLCALDGVRALSLILIVMFHTWQQTWIFYNLRLNANTYLFNFEPFQRYGYVAIDTFFVLSGFGLFYPIARDMFGEQRFGGWKNFFIKRLRRIYPAYALMLLILLIFPTMSWITNSITDPKELAKHFLSHLFFVHNFSASTLGSTISTAWTMAVEVQFYLLFPLICIPFRKKPIWTFAGMAVVSACLRLFLLIRTDGSQIYQAIPFAYLDVFGSGMLSAYCVVWARNKVKAIDRLRLPMTLISLACVAAGIGYIYWLRGMRVPDGLQYSDSLFRFLYRGIFAALMGLLIFSLCYSYKFWERGIWGNRFFVFLSSISYSYYLWHQNIYILLKRLNIPYSTMDPVMNDRHAMDGLTLLCLLSSLIISYVVTRYIETPIVKYGYSGCARRIWSAIRGSIVRKKRSGQGT